VYNAPFRIAQPLTLGRTPAIHGLVATGGAVRVQGALRYQACDDTVCYRPETVALNWTIPVR
jgi:hypothetical protein